MDGNKRRQAIIDILKNSLQPVSGTYLAKTLQVSRQVIVQDIALLRAGDYDIYSTHKGYVLNTQKVCKRIFKVHHDDNEVENMLKCISEVFGACNFVAQIPWRKRTAKSDVPFGISQDYEYILCFAKSSNFEARKDGKERKYYETPDFVGRPWRVHDLTKQTTASERPNSYFTIVNPKTGAQYPANPNRTWAITEDTFRTYYAENRIVFPGDYSFLNIQKPVLRYWKEDDMKKAGDKFGKVAVSTKLPDNIGMSQDGTKEITSLLGSKVFSFPKPASLIKYLIYTSTEKEDFVLDFFSGSATTAHAAMQLNAEEGGHR